MKKKKKQIQNSDAIFSMNLKRNHKNKTASLEITENGYKLIKGSYVAKTKLLIFQVCQHTKRNELIVKGLLQDIGDVYITTEDIYFKSPSELQMLSQVAVQMVELNGGL